MYERLGQWKDAVKDYGVAVSYSNNQFTYITVKLIITAITASAQCDYSSSARRFATVQQ
jgi:hypothetical protein